MTSFRVARILLSPKPLQLRREAIGIKSREPRAQSTALESEVSSRRMRENSDSQTTAQHVEHSALPDHLAKSRSVGSSSMDAGSKRILMAAQAIILFQHEWPQSLSRVAVHTGAANFRLCKELSVQASVVSHCWRTSRSFIKGYRRDFALNSAGFGTWAAILPYVMRP